MQDKIDSGIYNQDQLIVIPFLKHIDQGNRDGNSAYKMIGIFQFSRVYMCFSMIMGVLRTFFKRILLSKIKPTALNKFRSFPLLRTCSQKSDLVIITDDGSEGDKALKNLRNESPLLFLKNGLDLMEKDVVQMRSAFAREDFRASLATWTAGEARDCGRWKK